MSTISQVEQFFDDAASRYDDTLARNGWPANVMLGDALAGGRPIDTALDLGAGTGLSSEVILDVAQPKHLAAVDVSTKMLAQLRKRCENHKGVTTSRMAVRQFLDTTPSTFDLVVAIGLLHFFPEHQPVLSGISRVVGDKGRFIFTYDPFLPGHPTNGEEQTTYDVTVYRNRPGHIEDTLLQSGFKAVESQPFTPKPNSDPNYQAIFVVASKG